ncbi:hypothetical protein QYE76_067068 [Lolium multiflorum]|uniref:Uncharacterized protein n=1 Tax=Lolium multiflorum TaxID=4521 RepID=A0AAD8WAK8_LOLMU|nr:hypothetical protein QYE76_067068 [Lolium multiflorum]
MVGDGRLTYFWRDRWIGGYTAEELAPEVFAMVATRRKNTRLVAEALQGDAWIDDISGAMTEELWRQCLVLWEAVEDVERDVSTPDRILWKGAESGIYSAKCTYEMLCQGSVWCRVLHSAGLRMADPGSTGNLQRWWTEARKRVRKFDRKRFDSMVISTAWTIWKQRNARAFRNNREQKTVDQMVTQIRDDFHMWERARRGVRLDVARE